MLYNINKNKEYIMSYINNIIKIAEQGDKEVQHNLGVMYEKGEGVEQDFSEAFKWYKKSAEQGFYMAQNHLGYIYFRR